MHAKSGLRVVLEWKIYRPDSVIADVIQRSWKARRQNRTFSVSLERKHESLEHHALQSLAKYHHFVLGLRRHVSDRAA